VQGVNERPQPNLSVSVIIVSLRGGSALVRLVHSLAIANGSLEVLVADNGLAETTRSLLRQTAAKVLTTGSNLGFGAAVNRAASIAEGDVLVVLNDDIEPQAGFLDELVEPFSRGADMVAGVLVQEQAPGLIETAGIELDRALIASDYLYNEPVSRLEEPLPPPLGPSGGAAAYRRTAFFEAGGFDENFFIYCEDVDLAIRLRAAGAACALAPRARAVHAGSGTVGYGSLAKANIVGFSRGYLLRKYGVLHSLRSGPPALLAETIAALLLARQHRSLQPARARIRGWRTCKTRSAPPQESDYTVSIVRALKKRLVRARGRASTPFR
jgi:N-acetylglucosaminyl-diphospho-decaprenol L-rhamnosyltransferase